MSVLDPPIIPPGVITQEFPVGDPTASQLAAFGTFAAGFIMSKTHPAMSR